MKTNRQRKRYTVQVDSKFGQKFKKLRTESGVTLRQMGQALGLGPGTMWMLENGRIEPTFALAILICRTMDISIDLLAEGLDVDLS